MKRVSVLGATGSIGQNTLDLLARAPDETQIVALTGGRNIVQLAHDARRFRPQIVVTAHEDLLPDLRAHLEGTDIEAAAGATALCDAAARPADWVMSAIVGFAGLAPGLAALEAGADLALANKESLVAAGALVKETAQRHGAALIPVDSEHSAIAQALRGEDMARVQAITVTASGGAFRDWPLERLASATPEEAATHPNWDMGQRITIDSASMFNKALEVIETHEFFGVAPEQIKVLIHPESLVHALVTFVDGAMMAHLGPHDMRHAIGHALSWPDRGPLPLTPLDLAQIGQLNFSAPDAARHRPLWLADAALAEGGHMGAVLNGAKEAALDAFIARQIGFLDMAVLVETVMENFAAGGHNRGEMTLDSVQAADAEARRLARAAISDLTE